MNNFKYLTVIIVSIILFSCSKDDLKVEEVNNQSAKMTFSDFSEKLILKDYETIKLDDKSIEINDKLSEKDMLQLIGKFHSAEEVIYLADQKTVFVKEKKLDSLQREKVLKYKNSSFENVSQNRLDNTLVNLSLTLYDDNYYGGRQMSFNYNGYVIHSNDLAPGYVVYYTKLQVPSLGDFADKMSSYKLRCSQQYGKETGLKFFANDNANYVAGMFIRTCKGTSGNPLIPAVATDYINNVWWELTPGVKSPWANQNNALYIDNRLNSFTVQV